MTSAPIAEGRLAITLEKAFTTTQTHTKQEMQNFSKMTVGVIAKTNTNTNTIQLQKEIELTEPVSKAELSIGEGKQNLSSVVVNKDVNIRAVLDTSSVDNALYKNPVIEIQMPTQVKKVDIKSTNLLLDDELKIKETKVVSRNGRQIIQITLEGTQTDYYGAQGTQNNNVISKGANIILNTDITLNPLSASKTEEIVMYYTNQNTDLYEKTYTQKAKARSSEAQAIGMAKAGITIVGQNEVVTASGLSNYSTGKEDILSATEGTSMATLETYADKKVATVSGKVINNYANAIQDVVILGRFPTKDNTKIDTTESFGSTFSTSLNGEITLTGIDSDKYTIYYSNKVDAGKDLEDTTNGWVKTASADAKSYMIIVEKGYQLPSGAEIDFKYNTQIPQNLSYNQSSYMMYKIYYTNISDTGTKSESKISHIIGMTTGTGPAIEISVKSENATVREGQIVRMTATIKNNGNINAENAKLLITAPEGTVHTEIKEGYKTYSDSEEREKVISLGTIKAGETITKDYELRINKGMTIDEDGEKVNQYPGDKDLQNIVRLSASNITNEIKSEVYNLKVLKGDLAIVSTPNIHEGTVLKTGKTVKYTIEVSNISYDKDLNNVILNIPVPTGIEITDIYYKDSISSTQKITDNITKSTNNISINLGTLKSRILYTEALTANNEEDVGEDENYNYDGTNPVMIELRNSAYVVMEAKLAGFSGEYDWMMSGKADGIETQYSNVTKLIGESVSLQLEQKELENKYVKEGTEYTYHFVIKNTGKISSTSNKIEMTIPEGISLVKAQYTYQNKTKTESNVTDGKLSIPFYNIDAEDSIDLYVTVKANLLEDQNDKQITTKATLTTTGIDPIESNQITAVIEYDANMHKAQTSGNENHTNTKNSYKITGTAWLDSNKDGKKDENEELLSNITVLLLYKSNSELVATTTTNGSGNYTFNDLSKNEYLIVFLYDASKYNITSYQKEGVGENYNSDATNMKIVLDGEQRYAGVTNTIKISNSNVRDIDIGLYVSEKFDLRLDKYISKVTVTTPTDGKKVYNYNNAKLTKRDIYGKDVGSSSIVVEYKIVVTNEGKVDGYAKKLIDYLPQEAKFNTELNKDWYLSENAGAVYNNSLANQKIEPGQSKEVTLILNYSITEKIIGTLINNNAEIYESYNEQGLEDMDSNPANRLESEDDMSAADMMISLATGKIVIYISLAIAVIILLGCGIFEIKRHVLIKKKH